MVSKKVTPMLLAGSVALAGTLGLLGMVAPSLAAADLRVTSVDELTDVNTNHWAYEALRDLVEKYDVIEGYPDKKFRGDKPATRWEMAAALNDLLKAVGRDMARLGAEKADRADLETLARLQEEFRNELAALEARTDALEERATAIEAKNDEQDLRLSLLEKTQVHGDMSVGIMSNLSRNPDFGNQRGQQDTIQAIARLRLALDIPVKEASEEGLLGEGRVRTRLIGAWGNNAGLGASPGFSGLSRIATDRSAFNEGFATGSATTSTNRANVYVERLYYEQDLKPGIPLLTDLFFTPDDPAWEASGTAFFGVYPFRDFFDKSAYRGDELTQFQNTALVNIPGLPTNANFIGAGYAMKQGLGERANFNLTAATGAPNSDDLLQLWSVTYEARLNYLLPFFDDLAGAIYGGGYHTFNNGGQAYPVATGALLQRNGNPYFNNAYIADEDNHGLYAGWDQEIWNGIGFNVGYMYNRASSNSLVLNSFNPQYGNGFNNSLGIFGNGFSATPRQALNAVLHIPTDSIIPGFRTGDHLGVGYAMIDFQDPGTDIGGDDAFEQVMEAYYAFYLNDQISFVPSFQLIQNRLGLDSRDTSLAIGFRTNIRF